MEIYPQIYLIDTIKGSNVYLLDDRELALIDTGPAGCTDAILKFIANLGRRPEELSKIFITHAHADHIGSLWELTKRTGAKSVAWKADDATISDITVNEDTVYPYMGGLHLIYTQYLNQR